MKARTRARLAWHSLLALVVALVATNVALVAIRQIHHPRLFVLLTGLVFAASFWLTFSSLRRRARQRSYESS